MFPVGLIGAGIGESLTPPLHEREAAELGFDLDYELLDLDVLDRPPEAVGELLAEARDDGWRGVNVTHPCKQLVVAHLDALSQEASALHAVNTVTFEDDGMVGHNTDWPGFAEGFRRGLPHAALREVVLVGAGGAGTAVAHAALALGVERLHVVDEDADRSADLVASLGPRARAAAPHALERLLGGADGLIHATPTGMADHPGAAVDTALLRPDLWVADIVYRPLLTPLLEAAQDRGCRTLDGGRMAVFQAVYAFELFTGVEPDADRMLDHFAELATAEGSAVDKGIATVCLSGTLDEKLTAAAAAGFDSIEVFEPDLLGSPLSPSEVRSRADAYGLKIALYQPFRDFESVPPGLLERNLRRAEAKFDVMEELGADTLLVCSSVSPDAIDDDDLAAAHLRALAERADERGLRIAYEALAWGRFVNEYEHAWRIVAAADHPALGVCLDSFHILSRGSDPQPIRKIPKDKIFFLQLADAPRLGMDVLQWSRHYRCFPGQGAFPLVGFCGHVLAAGYDGPLSLEVFNDVFRRADPGRTAIDAMRSLLVLEAELGVQPLPEPPTLNGYAFAELAVAPDSATEAEALLHALGFRNVGPHRSKPVQLWEQKCARVLLNHGDPHPDGIAALAVESSDAARSVDRAEALGAPVLARRRRSGEADLAAVEAPDGTSVFFADRDREWLEDFLSVGDAVEPGAGITGIDHIALSQPFDAFDEAVLFYRSLLDLEPRESQDLATPDGLVRSRAVVDETLTVRLALNVPVLAGPGEAAPQHIAFRANDVLAVAQEMRERGVAPLAIPGNYYDDLAARHDIDDRLLADLRALDVLYDRDPRGEFLHLYTPGTGRVFFEVVERRGDYDGYGAANAPIRMAAQRTARVVMAPAPTYP